MYEFDSLSINFDPLIAINKNVKVWIPVNTTRKSLVRMANIVGTKVGEYEVDGVKYEIYEVEVSKTDEKTTIVNSFNLIIATYLFKEAVDEIIT